MHGRLGSTSHIPFSGPPQGPLRRFLGQVIGHTYSRWPRTQLPQAWQPKTGSLKAISRRSKPAASAGYLSTHEKTVFKKPRRRRGVLAGSTISATRTQKPRFFGGAAGVS